MPYSLKNKIRILTAASLFDGHDVSINIMRRILQASGAEVIHLGHNRAVQEVVSCAIQEDVNAIAITSYQGGHMEYFKYMFDLLKASGAGAIKIFGGGGGVILPHEILELQAYGITRIYAPDDGRRMGLQGMIDDMLQRSDFPLGKHPEATAQSLKEKDPGAIAGLISAVENYPDERNLLLKEIQVASIASTVPVLGITGTGGAGKSSLIDEFVRRYLYAFPDKTLAILSVDPSKKKTGGALLGDRIRMNAIHNSRVYMRSLATRQSNLALSKSIADALAILKAAAFDLIVLETAGIGQSDSEITEHAQVCMYVMTPEFGAPTQLEKIDMLDFADIVVLNKFDKPGAEDALRDVKKQYQRNRALWDQDAAAMPVYGTTANQFNDPGLNEMFKATMAFVKKTAKGDWTEVVAVPAGVKGKTHIIPPGRSHYLAEITEIIRGYSNMVEAQSKWAGQAYSLDQSIKIIQGSDQQEKEQVLKGLENCYRTIYSKLSIESKTLIEGWESKKQRYKNEFFEFSVRDKNIKIKTHYETLSHLIIPKIALPDFQDWGMVLKWSLQENVPGQFPYTAGVFSFKREGEDPGRMFAGEGSPERTNRRFHYVSKGTKAKRLSTAFDSVTLYGNDPDMRPDVYGKIGNAGVSVCCLDDAKKLYSGFDLCDPMTSVSMTINGPAPIVTGFFMNAAIDQQCELYIIQNALQEVVAQKIEAIYLSKKTSRPEYHGALPEGHNGLGLMLLGATGDQVLPLAVYNNIKSETLKKVRGTVQADILKEDQAQNTCIFSIEFSLRLMGDMQAYFISEQIRNFYSVSISGYHMAEAGANPITQLALTLSNGFTYIEYYLSRGMDINHFAPNLSFFFSNGIDPEYAVIGRVARRIWAKALKLKYGANERSQQLKYHIQTSGRSLHAQEIDFNDIRTTLQALYAIYDNCNSLHTNAYDEAITTPTEESVRRAMAIQLIINRELGLAKNENPLQGSFIIEELTCLVEEAVLVEFEKINARGGVLGAMETMYQRGKIQEESLYYETLKHSGAYPIIGVNTFLSSKGSPTVLPSEVIRATEEEKIQQVTLLRELQNSNGITSLDLLQAFMMADNRNENIFALLMDITRHCSLGQITEALFNVGGQYRRNM